MEKVLVVSYKNEWPQKYLNEKNKLSSTISSYLQDSESIEHVGSTSVLGSICRDIIDIQVAVKDLPPKPRLIQLMENMGYSQHSTASYLNLGHELAIFEKDGYTVMMKKKVKIN
eukprot:TRINITY_DN4471_c0_g1_i1.p1 TRINITY_DN4471_c0_g1~~TRINITY_DN4471_c0_g1_i1.p1  ORF type:complete len:125 (+),score=13.38 TRINITY_DN4471_c0_g1_i1:36-377(+)